MNGFVFTAAGQQLVSRMIAGEATATFTRVETSDHEYTKSEIELLTALVDVKQEVLISKVTRIDPAKVELLIALDNRELRETYIVKAIGVYARDSDQQEILFGIAVNTDTPDPMPVLTGKTISELTYHLVIAVAVSDQIEISVIPSAGATVEQLEELEGNVNEKVEQLLKKTTSLQSELESVQKELLGMVKQTAIVNTNTTTEAGFALDARQANPNIEGTMAANILKLNNDSIFKINLNVGDHGTTTVVLAPGFYIFINGHIFSPQITTLIVTADLPLRVDNILQPTSGHEVEISETDGVHNKITFSAKGGCRGYLHDMRMYYK